MSSISIVDKYRLYEESVQCHESDIEFLNKEYKRVYGKEPKSLREDFGGTALLACDWVRQGQEYSAKAIDLDPEPIAYGKENHYSKLNDDQKARMEYIEGNVLKSYDFKSDIVVAFNFSYFIFKKRNELVEYFTKVHDALNQDGMLVMDLFGGTDAREESIEETEHDDHSYFWDCDDYNPITHECKYAIHFKTLKDGKKYDNVFTYDWRLWGLAELRDILEDAGFKKSIAYWEGEDGDGGGDGDFFVTDQAENCESWVTYIVALP